MDGRSARSKTVDDFLREILDVCKKHGFSISHEDAEGAFLIEHYNEEDAKWLGTAGYKFNRKFNYSIEEKT